MLAVAFLLARRYVRRHWRLVRGHVATRGVLATLALVAGRAASATARGPRPRTSAAARRPACAGACGSAVEDAEVAVAHAGSHDAPVAELPAVCRSLRAVAGELDGLLRLERRLPQGAARPTPCAARWPRSSAPPGTCRRRRLRAGSDATEPQVRSLVRQARDEVDIVSAALARMRSLAQPH